MMSTDDPRVLFIDAVYNRPALWDHKHRAHHNRFVLEKLWEEVAADFKITKKEARTKWKNLRDKFRIEMQKLSELRASSEAQRFSTAIKIEPGEESTWPYFNLLFFLKDQFSSIENNHSVTFAPTTDLDPIKEDYEDIESIASSPLSESMAKIIDRVSPSSSPATRHDSDRKLDSAVEELQEKVKELELLKSKLDADDNSSADLAFFESLLPHIAKLSGDKKMLLMMDIQQSVYCRVYGMNGTANLGVSTAPTNTGLNAANQRPVFVMTSVETDPIQTSEQTLFGAIPTETDPLRISQQSVPSTKRKRKRKIPFTS